MPIRVIAFCYCVTDKCVHRWSTTSAQKILVSG
jgi:hypothetical protein